MINYNELSKDTLIELLQLRDTQIQFEKDKSASLLREIGEKIQPHCIDIIESKNDDMDIVLGEICRETVLTIHSILNSYSIVK